MCSLAAGRIMSRIVRCSLIQASNAASPDASLEATKQAMIDKHVGYIRQAADAGAQIVCLQEIFFGPYFCAEQTTRWYDFTEPVPDGPTIRLMRDLARQHHVALIVPVYEREQEGVYYNTAAVIHNDGTYLGKYRKTPHSARRAGVLGEVLLPARQPRLSGLRPGLRQDRRLHLLRPPFPGRRARAGVERRGDRFQSVGHGGGVERTPLEAGAAGARRGQRLLRRRHQPRGRGGAVEYRRVLRLQLFLRSARAGSSRRRRATRTKC